MKNKFTWFFVVMFLMAIGSGNAFAQVVTSADDSGPGTLRQVIAEATAGETITFDAALAGETITISSTIDVTASAITISGSSQTIVPAAGGVNRAFNVSGNGFTMERLHIDGFGNEWGAGVFSSAGDGDLVFKSCIFTNNKALGGQGGGAIARVWGGSGRISVYGCTFIGNEQNENHGSAIFNHRGGVDVIGCVFYGNDRHKTPDYAVKGESGTSYFEYNAVDRDLYGETSNPQEVGTVTIASNPFDAEFVTTDPALQILPDPLPANYPAVDFWGNAIVAGGYIGGAQAGAPTTPPEPEYFQTWTIPAGANVGDTWTLIDNRDDKSYQVVKMADGRIWLAQNFEYTEGLELADGLTTPGNTAGALYYDYTDRDNTDRWGVFYGWNAAQVAVPAGWHIPSSDEARALITALKAQYGNDDKTVRNVLSLPNDALAGYDYYNTGSYSDMLDNTNATGFGAIGTGCISQNYGRDHFQRLFRTWTNQGKFEFGGGYGPAVESFSATEYFVLRFIKNDPTIDPVTPEVLTSGLNQPWGIALDASGYLYVAENNANTVKRIDPTDGSATEFLAAGTVTYPRDLATDAEGNVYVVGYSDGNLYKITPCGDVSTLATDLSQPTGVVVDGDGNAYVASRGTQSIIKVEADGTKSTLATGFSNCADPYGIAYDATNDIIYAIRTCDGRVDAVSTADGTRTELPHSFDGPRDGAVDANGVLYVLEGNGSIYKIENNAKTAVFPTGILGLNGPYKLDVTPDGGILYVSNTGNGTVVVLKVDESATPATPVEPCVASDHAYDRSLFAGTSSPTHRGSLAAILDDNIECTDQGNSWHGRINTESDCDTKHYFTVDMQEPLAVSGIGLIADGRNQPFEVYVSNDASDLGSPVFTYDGSGSAYGTSCTETRFDFTPATGRYIKVKFYDACNYSYIEVYNFSVYGPTAQTVKIAVAPAAVEVYANDYDQLSALVAPDLSGETLTWSVADATVAAVDASGKVTGLKEGTTAVIATAGTYSASATVTVKANTQKPKVLLGKYIVLPESYRNTPPSTEYAGSNVVTIEAAATQPAEGFAFTISDLFGGYYEIGRGYGSGYRMQGTFLQDADNNITLTDFVVDPWGTGWDKDASTAEYSYVVTPSANDSTKLNLTLVWGDYTFYLFLVKELATPQEEGSQPPLPYGKYLQCYEFPSDAAAGTTWTLKDARDMKEYTALKFSDGSIWLYSDFNYTEGLTEDNEYKMNTSETDYPYYTYATAEAIAPAGWRLATFAEWQSVRTCHDGGENISNGGAAPFGGFLNNRKDNNGGGRFNPDGTFNDSPWGGNAPYAPWTTTVCSGTVMSTASFGSGDAFGPVGCSDSWGQLDAAGWAPARYIFDPALAALREPCNIDVSPEVVLDDVDIILGESDAWTSDGLHCGWGDSPGLKYKLELTEAGNLIYAPTADFQFSFFINTVDNMGFGGDVASIYIAGPATETVALAAGTYYLYFCLPNGVCKTDSYDLTLTYSIPGAATVTPLGAPDTSAPVAWTTVSSLPYTAAGKFTDDAVAIDGAISTYGPFLAYKYTATANGTFVITDNDPGNGLNYMVYDSECTVGSFSPIADLYGSDMFAVEEGKSYYIVGIVQTWSGDVIADYNYDLKFEYQAPVIPGVITALPWTDSNTSISASPDYGTACMTWSGAVPALKYAIELPTTTTAKVYYSGSVVPFFRTSGCAWDNDQADGFSYTFNAGVRYELAFTIAGGYDASAPYEIQIIPEGYNVPVTGISLTETAISVQEYGSYALGAIITPISATNTAVVWSTSDASIADVSQAGLVLGISAGTATITATTDDGGFTASATVTVTPAVTHLVTNTNDSGSGSLRQAIADAGEGEIVLFDDAIAFQTITLASAITVEKSVTIIGGSQVLVPAAEGYPAIYIPDGIDHGITVTISRLHFDGFHNTTLRSGWGGAITSPVRHALTVNVCIFTNNKSGGNGGAIVKVWEQNGIPESWPKAFTAYGCTFVNNDGGDGDAVWTHDHGIKVTYLGNIFINNGNVAFDGSEGITSTYNAYTGTLCPAKWNTANNVQVEATCIDADFWPTSDDVKILPATLPADYPSVDFFGTPVKGSGYAGAIQIPEETPSWFTEVPADYTHTGTFSDFTVDNPDWYGNGSNEWAADYFNNGVTAYKVTIDEAGTLKVKATGGDDFLISVYATEDAALTGDLQNAVWEVGEVTLEVTAGVYYILVDEYNGDAGVEYTFTLSFTDTAIDQLGKPVRSIRYFDLLGRPTTKDAKGFVIREILYEDGSVNVQKTFVRKR